MFDIKELIKSDKQFLLDKLFQYGSREKRSKQYSCVHCNSSDALSIKENADGTYIYHCFSCGTTGDIINLVKEKESISFYQSIKLLADEKGVIMPTYSGDSNKEKNAKFKISENINYANYKPDEKIRIEKYINQYDLSLRLALVKALNGENSLLIAPTGSGKTYSIIEMLKKSKDIKSIFIVPNAMNVEQISKEYEIAGAYGDNGVYKELEKGLEKGNVVVMTWDKFIQIDKELLKEYVVILDEVHQTYTDMFRKHKINKMYENLKFVKGQIHITATPNKLNFNNYSYILEYEQEVQTNYKVKIYDQICDDTINDIIKNSKKFALLKDDGKYLNFIKESNPTKKIDVITSPSKDLSRTYKEIISNGTMKKVDGICNTTVLVAGVNIYDKDVTDIIIVGIKDIATIKQYVARFRDLKSVNVHIFNKYREEESKTYDIEWLVDTRIQEISEDVDYYNKKDNGPSFTEQVLEISPVRIDNTQEFYWSNEEYKYLVSEIGIRNNCYTRYYSIANIEKYKVLLEEYFNNIEIVKVKEADNIARKIYNQITNEEKKEILIKLEEEKNILVGAMEVLTNKIGKSTECYFEINNINVDDLKEELEKKNIDNYIQVGNIAKTINLYTKYVVDNGYNYNLAWCIANKGNRARGKFFNQLNNIIYREIESKYPNLMRYIKIEDKLYNFITKMFTPGISYTEEHLREFTEAIEMTMPGVKITTNKLGELLSQIYNIENMRTKDLSKLQGIDFLFNKIYNPNPCNLNKQIKINTIKNFLTLEDVIKQNNLDELSLKVLTRLIKDRIEEIEIQAMDIMLMDELFKNTQ